MPPRLLNLDMDPADIAREIVRIGRKIDSVERRTRTMKKRKPKDYAALKKRLGGDPLKLLAHERRKLGIERQINDFVIANK